MASPFKPGVDGLRGGGDPPVRTSSSAKKRGRSPVPLSGDATKKHVKRDSGRDDERDRLGRRDQQSKGSDAAEGKQAPGKGASARKSPPAATDRKEPAKSDKPLRAPSPPPGPPSGLAEAMSRLTDLTAQMEFAYAKQLKLQREQEVVRAKIELLEKLPVGSDAYREDLERLTAAEVDEEVKKIAAS